MLCKFCSNSTIPEHQQQSPLDGVKAVENISEYFDDVARKIPGKKTISMRKSSISSFLPKVKGSLRRPKAEKPSLSAAFNMSFNKFDVGPSIFLHFLKNWYYTNQTFLLHFRL